MIRPGIWRRELAVPLQSIQAELNRFFEEFWHSASAMGPAPVADVDAGPVSGRTRSTEARASHDLDAADWVPTIDLWEATSELILVIDLPGVDPATIDLSLTGNILVIRGTRASQPPEVAHESARGRVRERPVGSFSRQVTLVDEIDFDRIQAQARDGVLTVRLPKRGEVAARTIPIQPA